MTVIHEFFTEARIALQREIVNHSELCAFINQLQTQTWEEQLGVVTSYLGKRIDGSFLPEELEVIYEDYLKQLVAMRTEREEFEAQMQPTEDDLKALAEMGINLSEEFSDIEEAEFTEILEEAEASNLEEIESAK